MDILIEILLEVYMELMFLIIPEQKRGKRHRVIAVIVAFVVMIGFMALAIWGCDLIWEKGNPLGWIPLMVAIVLSVVQIVAGIILFFKREKRN